MAQGMVIRSSNLSTGEFPDALSKIYQHQSLLASLIDEKEAASCSGSWCHIPVTLSLLTFKFPKFHGLWVQCQLNSVKQGLKNPLMVFLFTSMLKYLGFRILLSSCGASMGI